MSFVLGHPPPLFPPLFPPFSVVRPTQIFVISNKGTTQLNLFWLKVILFIWNEHCNDIYMHRSFGGVPFLLLLMTPSIIFPPYWVYVDLVTMPCCFQSPWQWGYSIFTPLWMRFCEGVFKSYLRGGGCVGTLWSLENFWAVWGKNSFFLTGERKKGVFLKGGLCCYFWSFFLGGKRQFTLST